MNECENIEKCAFFSQYKVSRQKYKAADLVLRGIIREFCKGAKRKMCIRKMLFKALGPHLVPVNMMPQGRAITGTDNSHWTQEVKTFVAFARSKNKYKNI